MSSVLFDTQVKIGINDTDFKKGISEAGELMKGFASVGVKAIETVTTSVLDMSKSFIDGVTDLANYGDHIDKQSQKMNMSAKKYQEWDAIMKHSGTTIDSMTMAMKTLSTAAETDADAFEALGMNLDDVKQLSSEDLFERTITALQDVEDDTKRTYLASKLLGRGATELGALLNMSAEETEQMRQRVHELGGVMGDDAVKASAAFKDSLQDMQTAFGGLKKSITSDFLPSFTEVTDGLTKIFAGEEGGEDLVTSGITHISENLGKAAGKLKPVIKRVGTSVIGIVKANAPKLIKGFIEELPKLISEAGGLFATFGTAVIDGLPQLADAAFTAVSSFSGFLRENLPQLIPQGVNAMVEFAKGITDPESLSKLADAAFDVVDGFIIGLTDPNTLDKIIEGAPVIVDNVITGIAGAVDRLGDSVYLMCTKLVDYFGDQKNRDKLKEAGEKILDSIAAGFESMLVTAGTTIYNLGGYIAHNIGLGEYWDCGNDAMKDFADGFKDYWTEFKKWFNIEVADLLNPASMVKSVTDSVKDRVLNLEREKNGKSSSNSSSNNGFNYDELEQLPVYGPSVLPNEYNLKHGNLSDRKHALGGIFTRPVTIGGHTFGENGIEGLLPLENNTSWMDKLVNKINNGGNRYYTINVYADNVNSEADFDRLVEKIDRKLADKHVTDSRAIGATGW